jgi:putative DNA primase/helicase
MENSTETIRLAWFRDGRWNYRSVERVIIAISRTITSLAGFGVPVTDDTAKLLVEFLSKFEALNINNLPLAQVTNYLGWQTNNRGFLWGKTHIQKNVDEIAGIDLDTIAPVDWQKDFIAFKGSDEGDHQIADGFIASGTYEDWVNAVNRLYPYPLVVSGVYFSLIPAFLDILGAKNFTVDWAYTTSTGKTTLLRIAGSCWGNPDERSTASVVHSWDATKVWIEKAAAMLHGLPLILDDTKLAGTGKY